MIRRRRRGWLAGWVRGGLCAIWAGGGGREVGDGAFFRSEEGAEHVPGEPVGAAFGGGGEIGGGADELLKALVQEWGGVFL